MRAPSPTTSELPVLLPFRVSRTRTRFVPRPAQAWLLGAWLAGLVLVVPAFAQGADAVLSPLQVVLRWAPLLLTGFAFNVAISLVAMLLGTGAGVGLGLGLVSEVPVLRRVAWGVTQFFRNVPWLVLLFFVMFLVPFQVTVLVPAL